MNWNWVIWAVVLLLQNAAGTVVSRARNSDNLLYHGGASIFSNGVWFISQLILVDQFTKILRNADWYAAMWLGLFYTACTMTGSIGMHWISMNLLEKKKGS